LEESLKNHDKKKRIIDKYNSTSYFYDKRYRAIQSEKYEIVFNNYRANGKNILDMGCGTGLLFEYITKLILNKGVIRCNYVAVDISWNMLLEFRSKVINLENRKNSLNLILSDIECLPFRENTFYSIFSLTAFQNLPSIENGIEELYRVCKHNADFKFSILKKKLELEKLIEILKPKIEDLDIIKKEDLEDIVIQGKISKV
jgi:demethylmenaquinone methyltransferase/2-methoxy-6-polyprenyl-1,4-benzoquinol methylase